MYVHAFADKFSVSKTQITDIIVNKDAFYKTWAENENGQSYKKQKPLSLTVKC